MQGWLRALALAWGIGAALPAWGEAPRVWAFTATEGSRHESIPAAVECIEALAREHGFGVEVIEDPARIETQALATVAAMVWLNASGNVPRRQCQAARRSPGTPGATGLIGPGSTPAAGGQVARADPGPKQRPHAT